MSAIDALNNLKRGNPVNCVTPDGLRFQIQSKLSFGIALYRVRPARRGCLNRYSRLSDGDMLQWLESVSPNPSEEGGKMNCADCNHIEHKPGQCKSCNCGESGLVHLTSYRKLTLAQPSTSTLSWYGYDMGHRVPKRRTDNQ